MKMKNITTLTAVFENGDNLVLSIDTAQFGGYEAARVYQLTYGERCEGNYAGVYSGVEGEHYFMTINTEYFSKDKQALALVAFNSRLRSEQPYLPSELGQSLESFLIPSVPNPVYESDEAPFPSCVNPDGSSTGTTLGKLLRDKLRKMKPIKFAKQGVRQAGFSSMAANITVLKPGDVFISLSTAVGEAEDLTIPDGCIGIMHYDEGLFTSVSVIRDDCKAARKALHKANSSINK